MAVLKIYITYFMDALQRFYVIFPVRIPFVVSIQSMSLFVELKIYTHVTQHCGVNGLMHLCIKKCHQSPHSIEL